MSFLSSVFITNQVTISPEQISGQLMKALESPDAQKILAIVSDPDIVKNIAILSTVENAKHLLIAQLIFLVLFGFFRWFINQDVSLTRALFNKVWTFVLYWILSIFIIPLLVLQKPYYNLCVALFKSISEQYF